MLKHDSTTLNNIAVQLADQFTRRQAAHPAWPFSMSIPCCCRRLPAMLAAMLLCSVTFSHAQSDDSATDKDLPPQEIAIVLPAPPLAENLLPFAAGPDASQSFAIDAKSLSVNPDGIIRYTLIARSTSGAQNVSYEGLRCQSLEMKRYAFGQKDGSWSRPRRDLWQAISFRAPNRPQAVLVQDYFCQGSAAAGKAEDMLARIRNKRPLAQ